MNSRHEHHLEADGFRFNIKARPITERRLAPDAPPALRQAWAQVQALGIHPDPAAFPEAREEIVGWRFVVRAETRRTLAEVAEQPWPSETHIVMSAGESTATLICYAAAEIPAGTDYLQAMADRLRLEGPIGEAAATAFVAASLGTEVAR